MLLIDPETDTGMGEFLKSCGIEVGQDMIVDKLSRLFGADYLTPIVSQYADYHPITENFQAASFFPLARSVSVAQDLPPQVENTEIAKTGPSSWAETDLVTLKKGDASFDKEEDTMGPIPVAVVSTIQHEPPETKEAKDSQEDTPRPARVVVFGDSDFAGNTYLNLSGNRDLFMNTLSWLAEEEDLIAIRPKKRESQPVVLSYAQGRIIFWVSVVLLPGGVLIIGTILLRWKRVS